MATDNDTKRKPASPAKRAPVIGNRHPPSKGIRSGNSLDNPFGNPKTGQRPPPGKK